MFFRRYWLDNGTPGKKIVVGIPAYGNTWKLTKESSPVGTPPLIADGPGAEGPHSRIPGVLAYPEVCSLLTERTLGRLVRISDPSKKYGVYAYRKYDKKTRTDGIWIGYDDPGTAELKAQYVKSRGLGGVAIYDLSLDDFRGTCTGEKFPIVKAVKNKLSN